MSSEEKLSEIEESMVLALDGNRSATAKFFEQFLTDSLYVPERFQAMPVSDQPRYPNEFMNILGLEDGDRTIIPAFSRVNLIEEWCGQELQHKAITGRELLSLVPEEWWVTVNPGLDIEKELSPWELSQLKAGSSSIRILLEELYPPDQPEILEFEEVEETDYPELKKVIIKKAKEHPEISKLYLAKIEEDEATVLILGVEASGEDVISTDELEDSLRRVIDLAQIGGDPVRIRIGDSVEGNLLLGAFSKVNPFYSAAKKQSFSLASIFRK